MEILKALLEIGILWIFYDGLLTLFRGSVAVQVLRGVVVLGCVFSAAVLLHLEVLTWLFTKIVAVVAIAFIVIFQPELRKALARIGWETLFRLTPRREEVVEEIVRGALALSRRRIGAILAIEGESRLQSYVESGVPMDATITSELLQTLFMQGTPLHDGGVVIARGRLVAAACLFPLSENPQLSKTLGTRHRAAIGLSEETDAVIIVISEETGQISVAQKGKMTSGLDREELAKILYGAAGTRPQSAPPSPPEKEVLP